MFCYSDQLLSLELSQKCLQSTQQDYINKQNRFFQSSEKISHEIEVRNLSAIHPFSIHNIVSHFEKEETHHHLSFINEDSPDFNQQESFNNAFSLDHGLGASYQSDQGKLVTYNIDNWMLPESSTDEKTISAIRQTQKLSHSYLSYQSSQCMEQEFQSKDQESLDKHKAYKDTKINSSNTLQSTKNVTKNIGKLLLKCIWKNRKHLQHQMQVNNERWSSFINQIRKWKGQNNITRQYLLVRWNGASDNHILFRKISRHFFRKQCLSALYASKISAKRLHLQRITKFDGAITNPQCLDYIN